MGKVDIPMTAQVTVAPGATPFAVSARYPAASLEFTRIPTGMRQVEWHPVPARVLTVRLTGAVDYETSDGAVRHVAAGAFVLVEDTHGKGHLSRHSAGEQTVLWIRLPEGLGGATRVGQMSLTPKFLLLTIAEIAEFSLGTPRQFYRPLHGRSTTGRFRTSHSDVNIRCVS